MNIKPTLKKTKMLSEAKSSGGHNVLIEIIFFVLVFFVGMVIESVVMAVPMMQHIFGSDDYKLLVEQYSQGIIDTEQLAQGVTEISMNMPDYITVITLFATVIVTLTVLIYCRFIEKRKLSTLGFRKGGILKEYLIGMLVGTGLFSVAVGICLLTGALSFDGVCQNISWGYLGLFFIGYLLQGMSEEVVFRGYFTVSMSRRVPVAVAIAISSVGFACAHLGNNGVSVLAFVNLTLFGVFAAVYMLKRGNIWGVCAIHSLWNFVQGNLYGISVSGMGKTESIMEMSSVASKSIINGGDFGLEGGIAVTIVLTLATVVMLLTKTKQSEIADEMVPQQSEAVV